MEVHGLILLPIMTVEFLMPVWLAKMLYDRLLASLPGCNFQALLNQDWFLVLEYWPIYAVHVSEHMTSEGGANLDDCSEALLYPYVHEMFESKLSPLPPLLPSLLPCSMPG